jgi:hypothetical protein
MSTPTMTGFLLRASDYYTVLDAWHLYDDEGFAFFRVEDGSRNEVAQVALWRDEDGLETCDGWCEWSAAVQHALDFDEALGSDGVLNPTALQASIFQACLEADAEAGTITAKVGDGIHEEEITVEVLLGGRRVGSVRATRCRDHRHPEGGLAVSVEDAESICLSVEEIERAASKAFRSAWSDPLHPTPAWVLREAVEAYADMIGPDITDDDVRELGFAGALSEYHGHSNAMREQQPWTVLFSAAQVAAMAEWHAAL